MGRIRSIRLAPLLLPALWGAVQCGLGWSEYRFATASAAWLWAAFAVLFAAAADQLSEERRREQFLTAVHYTGGAIALLALVQSWSGDGRIYGLFPAPGGRPFGPFVNANHFAAWMELVLPVSLWACRRSAPRHGAIVAAEYAAVVAAGSRAGAAIATVELLAGSRLARSALPLGLAALAVAFSGADRLWQKLHDSDLFELRREITLSSLDLIGERPLTGFGLGTFEFVYPAYVRLDTGQRVNHAHNDWLEWAVEGGLPLALLMVLVFAWCLPAARRNPWAWGIYAVLAHALVDFPLRIPAIGATLFVLLGALRGAGRPPGRTAGPPPEPARALSAGCGRQPGDGDRPDLGLRRLGP